MPEPEVMLAETLERERAGPGRPVETPWRGSTLGNCLRQQVALAQGVEPTEPITAETMFVFERGHTVGWYVGTRILDRDPHVLFHVGEPGTELAVHDSTRRVTGHVDQLVAFDDNTWELWEIKSLAPGGIKWLGDKPKPEHATQAGLYSFLVARDLGIEIAATRVVYVTVGSAVTVKSFPLDADAQGRALRVLSAANYYLDRDRLPPRLLREQGKDGKWPWPCGFCPVLTWCRGPQS